MATFPKKQQEKEGKLLKLYENQQQRAMNTIGKNNTVSKNTTTTSTLYTSTTGGGKVRQMFDERRQKAGIDRSYPLEPLKQEITTNMATATAPSKIGVRTNTNTQKLTTTSSLTSRPNGNFANKSSNIQRLTQSLSYHNNNSVINNKKGNTTSYKSHNDFDNDDSLFHRDQQIIIDSINGFNIEDDVEDAVMLAYIDQTQGDSHGVGGKLANLGGKLPSETTQKIADPLANPTNSSVLSGASKLKAPNNYRKEIKATPLIKRTSTVKPSASPIRTPTPSSRSSSSSSMSKPRPQSNQPTSARSAPPRSNTAPGTPNTDRTPNTQRPSSKQTPRGPSAVQRDDLDECRYCHRRFAGDRLQTHEEICARTANKKRKQYDATKHRLEGTELAPFVSKASKGTSVKSKASAKGNNWRQKHEEFIATIRSAKMAQQHVAKGGKLSDLPPPPPSTNADYVQCPHCGRRFNEAAAERHIPKCASYDYNKSKSGPNKGRAR